MPKPIAIWNSARDVWETPETEGLLCEHLGVYSEVFPTSGMTVNGAAYELPTWEPATDVSAFSSLLPTATARDWRSGGTPESYQERAQTIAQPLSEIRNLLPTVTVSDTNGPGKHGDGGLDLRTSVSLLPTTRAQHGEDRNSNIYPRPLDQPQNLENSLARLLPTPKASDGEKGGPNQRGSSGDLTLPSASVRIGANTPQPSDDGSESLDGQLRGQLNLLDAITDTD